LGSNNPEPVGIIRIGTSGFQFEDWKGSVYPQDITEPAMLSYYEKHLGFDTVEINFTYYRLPSPKQWRNGKKDFRRIRIFRPIL